MAALKLIFLLCATVFFTYAQVPEFQFQSNLKDAKSEALALLAQLEQSLKQAAAVVLPQVNDLYQLLDNTVIAVLDDSRENLKAYLIIPILEEIAELQDAAAEADVDITECIGSTVDDISALSAQFLTKVRSCVEGIVAATKQYVNQTVMDIASTLDVVPALADEINICGKESSVEQVQCFADVSANITENINTLPIQIIYDGVTMRTFVYSAIPEIAMCSVGILDDLADAVNATVYDVCVCALEKINGTLVLTDLYDEE